MYELSGADQRTKFIIEVCGELGCDGLSMRVEEVVDQVIAKFEVEAAGVLRGVLGIGVVGDYVGGAACRVEIEMAAKAVLPSGVADQF